jgi:hypothetical protein
MAEKLDIVLSKAHLEQLLNGKLTIDNFLKHQFSNAVNHAAMCSALQEYHRNDGGSPEVHVFDVMNGSFNPQTLTGSFRCNFRVIYHYTCSDVRNNAADTIDWDFKIDALSRNLYLTGEETLERDGDEF